MYICDFFGLFLLCFQKDMNEETLLHLFFPLSLFKIDISKFELFIH